MKTQMARNEATRAVAEVFRIHGYDGASMSLFSEATGLGRSSLYHYFPEGKLDMARSVLEQSTAFFREEIFSTLRTEGTAEARLAAFGRKLSAYYAEREAGCLLGVFTLSDAPVELKEMVAGSLRGWIAALAGIYGEAGMGRRAAGRAAEAAVARFYGALILRRATGEVRYLNEAIAHMTKLA